MDQIEKSVVQEQQKKEPYRPFEGTIAMIILDSFATVRFDTVVWPTMVTLICLAIAWGMKDLKKYAVRVETPELLNAITSTGTDRRPSYGIIHVTDLNSGTTLELEPPFEEGSEYFEAGLFLISHNRTNQDTQSRIFYANLDTSAAEEIAHINTRFNFFDISMVYEYGQFLAINPQMDTLEDLSQEAQPVTLFWLQHDLTLTQLTLPENLIAFYTPNDSSYFLGIDENGGATIFSFNTETSQFEATSPTFLHADKSTMQYNADDTILYFVTLNGTQSTLHSYEFTTETVTDIATVEGEISIRSVNLSQRSYIDEEGNILFTFVYRSE